MLVSYVVVKCDLLPSLVQYQLRALEALHLEGAPQV